MDILSPQKSGVDFIWPYLCKEFGYKGTLKMSSTDFYPDQPERNQIQQSLISFKKKFLGSNLYYDYTLLYIKFIKTAEISSWGAISNFLNAPSKSYFIEGDICSSQSPQWEKFRFSEKAAKIWCNLSQGLYGSYLESYQVTSKP